jgi:hypothetical protein
MGRSWRDRGFVRDLTRSTRPRGAHAQQPTTADVNQLFKSLLCRSIPGRGRRRVRTRLDGAAYVSSHPLRGRALYFSISLLQIQLFVADRGFLTHVSAPLLSLALLHPPSPNRHRLAPRPNPRSFPISSLTL